MGTIHNFLPRLTLNESFFRDFMAVDVPCFAMGLVEERGWILGSESKVHVRFSTPLISEYIYINKISSGWKKKESFLLELHPNPDKDSIQIKTTISPSIDGYDSSRLSGSIIRGNLFSLMVSLCSGQWGNQGFK